MRVMKSHLSPFEALHLAARNAGGQSALARMCGVSPTAVWKWLQSSKRLPAEYVLRVEAATGVSRHALRPDIYPLDGHAAPPADAEPVLDCAPIMPRTAIARKSNRAPVLDRSATA